MKCLYDEKELLQGDREENSQRRDSPPFFFSILRLSAALQYPYSTGEKL